jgi:hypothetical protein
MSPQPIPVGPTFVGHVATTQDALILFQACVSGFLPRLNRRLTVKERAEIINSGTVIIFNENSGIKRWTDGISWSPSRILGDFLVYRQLEDSSRGEEHRLVVKRTSPHSLVLESEPGGSLGDLQNPRSLVGSLTNSYVFKKGGLVKKTASLSIYGVQYHLISYYRIEDIMDGRYYTPSDVPTLSSIIFSRDIKLNLKLKDFGDASDKTSVNIIGPLATSPLDGCIEAINFFLERPELFSIDNDENIVTSHS